MKKKNQKNNNKNKNQRYTKGLRKDSVEVLSRPDTETVTLTSSDNFRLTYTKRKTQQ